MYGAMHCTSSNCLLGEQGGVPDVHTVNEEDLCMKGAKTNAGNITSGNTNDTRVFQQYCLVAI